MSSSTRHYNAQPYYIYPPRPRHPNPVASTYSDSHAEHNMPPEHPTLSHLPIPSKTHNNNTPTQSHLHISSITRHHNTSSTTNLPMLITTHHYNTPTLSHLPMPSITRHHNTPSTTHPPMLSTTLHRNTPTLSHLPMTRTTRHHNTPPTEHRNISWRIGIHGLSPSGVPLGFFSLFQTKNRKIHRPKWLESFQSNENKEHGALPSSAIKEKTKNKESR